MFPFAWTGIFAAIPLMFLKPKLSSISGFLIGFIAPLSIYILYPIDDVIKLSSIIGSIVGLPTFVVFIIFPIIYGIIMSISAVFFSGLYERKKNN